MALYQPKVVLTWKYLQNVAAPGPNLKIVWSVGVDLLPSELVSFSRASLRDTVIMLSTGGNLPGNFTEEWDAPFTVSHGLPDTATNRDHIRGQIEVNGSIKITTTFKKDGKVEGESINNTSQNSNILWN